MTEFTNWTIIVVQAHLQRLAEQAAVAADPEGGAGTFVPGVGLRNVGDETNTIVAYVRHWPMKTAQRATFASTIGGPNNILPPGASVPLNRDRWFFDAAGTDGWTLEQALAALGYERPAPTLEPGE